MAMAATMSLDSTRFAREGRGRCTRARGLVPGARPRVVLRNVASDTRGKGRGRYPRTNKAVTCMAVTRVMISGKLKRERERERERERAEVLKRE